MKGDSHFWSGLVKVKDEFVTGGKFKVQNGKQARFWEDIWMGDMPFRYVYPNLHRIVRRKHDTVANILRTVPLNVSFRRGLIRENLPSWYELVPKIVLVNLTNGTDVFWWSFNKNCKFIVRSMYMSLIRQGVTPRKKHLWNLRVPLKIKVFLYYLQKELLLLKIT
jgi:hypothetical protein